MQIILQRILNIANRAFDYILLTIMLFVGSLGIYFLWDASNTYNNADSKAYKQYKPAAGDERNFEELQGENPDVMAWLSIEDTKIDYPVVQASNNAYYLTRDVEKTPSSAGSIFIDSECDGLFNDFNTIIYGHHMAYGTMFGELDKFCDKDFFRQHTSGKLYCDGINYKINFFAFFDKADGYDKNIYTPHIQGEDAKESYLHYLEKHSKFYRNIGVSTRDRIVILSTCNHTMTNGRYILVGKLGKEELALIEDSADVGMTRADAVKNFFKVVPWGMWLLIILLFILLIVVMNMRKKFEKRR